MTTVFEAFQVTPYEFLEINRGTIVGDVIANTVQSYGVFKLRNGMNVSNDQETKSSDATLHVYPDEAFVSTGMVGHGIRWQGREYEIVGVTEGRNFDNNDVEHYRLTLQATDFSELGESS